MRCRRSENEILGRISYKITKSNDKKTKEEDSMFDMAGKASVLALVSMATTMLNGNNNENELSEDEDKDNRKKAISEENKNPVVSGAEVICPCSGEPDRTVCVMPWTPSFNDRNGGKGLRDVDTKFFPKDFGFCKSRSMLCTPIILDHVWKGCDYSDKIDGRPSVKMNSYMICEWGYGMIILKNHGQEPSDGNESDLPLSISVQGIEMVKEFELSIDVIAGWGLGEYNAEGELIGVYPHYVFRKKGEGPEYESDGGITFGYGHYVSVEDYNDYESERKLVDTYAPNASLLPSDIPNDGHAYKVPNSSYVPIEEIEELLRSDLDEAEEAVNEFLEKHEIQLNQNQFDALISFTHQHGKGWWRYERKEEKKLPKFIREGKGEYDAADVEAVFLLHRNKGRRKIEADVFNYGYKGGEK